MYKLYFDDLFIGDIRPLGADFPCSHGEFHLHPLAAAPVLIHISRYIAHSIRISDFYMEQTISNPHSDVEDELLKEELEFDDLINSDQWRIIHINGEVTKILIPVFHSDGSVGWRLA
jgi:hypothetical protein